MQSSDYLRSSVNFAALVLAIVWTLGCKPEPKRPAGFFVRFPNCSFSGNGREFNTFWVGGEPRGFQVHDVFIRDAEGNVHDLALLSEETAQAWVDKYTPESLRERAVDQGRRDMFEDAKVYRFPGRSLLFFHQGKLIDASFVNAERSPFENLEVGRSADGEFVKMPVTREEMIRVFGEPLKETR
jgi:hypothetical protein